MIRLILLSMLLLPLPVTAQQFNEAELGTLFTTPATRDRLDNVRQRQPQQAQAVTNTRASKVTVNGIVRGSDGRSTVWVNGKKANRAASNGVRVPSRQQRSDKVSVMVNGNLVRIRPGESWTDKTDN